MAMVGAVDVRRHTSTGDSTYRLIHLQVADEFPGSSPGCANYFN